MSNRNHGLRKVCISAVVVLVGCTLAVYADVPRGWFLAGSTPSEFEVGLDTAQAYQGHSSAFLRSRQPSVEGFGTLMQKFAAKQYLGKRVRLRGMVRTEDVTEWAGLWMRVDKDGNTVVFDNMRDRPIKGTTGWQRYDVVLDVPNDATDIALGILLSGPGEVWLSNTTLDVVGTESAPTGSQNRMIPEQPVNLDFEE